MSYIYIIFNKDWNVPIYVGKGTGNRYKDMKHRSNHILSIIDRYDCVPVILQDNLEEDCCIKCEQQLKIILKNMGYPIIDYEKEGCSLNQREGIEKAKREGKYKGRKEVKIDDFADHYERYKNRKVNKVELAKELGISRPTLDKMIKQYMKGNL